VRAEIHPDYKDINVICSCGSSFVTRSTVGHDLHIEVCSQCHPFLYRQTEDPRYRRSGRQVPPALWPEV